MRLSLKILTEIRRCSKDLQKYFEAILKENERLRVENAKLLARTNANSTNSNTPPSSNPFKKLRSLRVKTGKKPGAQIGHKGSTLKINDNPDKVVRHKVDACSHCGRDISGHSAFKHKKHQVIDVMVTRVVTEHQAEVKGCPYCGKQTSATFPYGTGHYVQYGPCYSAMMVCFNQGNHIPYDRLSKISEDIFGIAISLRYTGKYC
jgi:transposase